MAKQAHKDRLTAIDASFLHQEKQASHMHVGRSSSSTDRRPAMKEFAEQTESLSLVPRYRQKLAFPRLEMGRPFWVDDPSFNLDYHVRHWPSRPGSTSSSGSSWAASSRGSIVRSRSGCGSCRASTEAGSR